LSSGRCNPSSAGEVLKLGLTTALDLSYERTKPFLKPYVMQEIQGLADASAGAVSVTDIRNVMWLGELTRGACSMFGAKDSATRSRGGKLLQLRALDWDVDGPFKNHAAIVVYHPEEGHGYPWANVGFHGWTASITGFSSQQLGLSEIGVSFPDASFGPETYLAKGYPFGYLIRDVLQFDRSLEEATARITGATRTCDLLLGVGDGKSNEFSGFQYSPHVARVIKPENLLPANDTWHPKIADVVYWGMDWICPNDNRMLSEALRRHHGNLTAENTISDVTSYVTTGNLHIAIYDHAAMQMFVATARPDGAAGPLYAFERQFTRLDMARIFQEAPPRA
jgi:isopenicillin-N N-acyltransferase-like protein